MFRWHGIIAFSSNYELYADMSNRVDDKRWSEPLHAAKFTVIDGGICDLTGSSRTVAILPTLAGKFGETVLRRTHLYGRVGIAQTKTPAKLANHAAKQRQRQTGGVVDLVLIWKGRGS